MNDPRGTSGGNQYSTNEYRRQMTSTGNAGGQPRRSVQNNGRSMQNGSRPPQNRPTPNSPQQGATPDLIKQQRRKRAQKKMIANNVKHVSLVMVVVLAISALIATVTISCINDVLMIHIPENRDKSASVVIEDGMNTNSVIDALSKAGVIKNGWFCKLAAKVIGYSDDGYIARTYELKRSMGLENMLNEIKNKTSKAAKTITLTFPEGYSADQIIDMLVTNKVCSREAIIKAMDTVDFGKDFDFLLTVSDPEKRYIRYDGFLFPDTYDFYIGENAESVLRKFFNNFARKWTEDYAEKMQEKQLSVDQVIKLASIVEKEAASADMPTVASILLNRLDADMRLECNSTGDYIKANKSELTAEQINAYEQIYDTYVCDALPAGAICNPGTGAISAVLNAPDTGYYYFMHDVNNEMHVAKTLSEHDRNIANYGLAQ